MSLVEGRHGGWEVVIGLEVHARLLAGVKLFSDAPASFGGAPNSQVSLVDAAMPGMLPVVNEACLRQAVRTGLGLGARINRVSVFDRKNYFYPDLPQGYQISQYTRPIAEEGTITLDPPEDGSGSGRTVRIERLHLEQDAGKLLHGHTPGTSLVDLNRAGMALLEIVSRPDLRSAAEAAACVAKLRSILRYLETCDGNMEEGSLRADVNVSVRRPGGDLGTRCEIKNINSVRFVRQAADYEARRQIGILEAGGTVDQETRLFDPDRGETRTMRSKEEAFDYRYFPDPDLPPVCLDEAFIAAQEARLPELPDARKARFLADFGLPAHDAAVLVADRETADFFEAVVGPDTGRDPKAAANWIVSALFGRLNREGLSIAASPVSPDRLGQLLDLLANGTISGRIAREVFADMFEHGEAPAAIVRRKGLTQITDTGAVAALVDRVIADNPDQVAQYRAGNARLAGWLTGQILRASQGKANPGLVNRLLRERIDS